MKTPEYPVGTLKADDQLAIDWNRGFFTNDSFNQVYLLNDTGALTQITNNDSYSYMQAQWSPDASKLKIAESYSYAQWAYLAAGDGSGLREITPDKGYMQPLVWSPDSRYLLCLKPETPVTAAAPASAAQTYLYDTETDTYRTIGLKLYPCVDYVWSGLDNKFLIARQNQDRSIQLEHYDFVTEQLTLLPPADYLNGIYTLKFSPDGTQIAYSLPDKQDRRVVHAARLDGSDQRRLTTLHKYNVDGVTIWSPDGKKLALTDINPVHHKYVLQVIDSDGTNKRELMTLNDGDESGEIHPTTPVWSADSQQIAIPSSIEAGDDVGSAVFVMDADGSKLRQVTDATGLIYEVAWKPR